MPEVYIHSYARTPIGSFQGSLAFAPATELCAIAVKEAVKRSKIEDFDELIVGNVISANLGQNPSKRVARLAGLPASLPSSTVEKVCSSGMKAIIMGADAIASGRLRKVIVGGMESMSRVPWALDASVRKGSLKFGSNDSRMLIDLLRVDGLEDEETLVAMGECAEMSAVKFFLTREQIDRYAIQSYERSIRAADLLKKEIIAVNDLDVDEEVSRFKRDKFPLLKSPFKADGGVITAGNASPMSDGASAIVLSSCKKNATGRLVAWADASQDALDFPSTPVLAIKKVLEQANLSLSDIDKFEINEAFAIVPLIVMKELGIEADKVNVWGGSVSLGHPLGSSGNRICGTLLNQLMFYSQKYGLAVICNGGGGASAVIVENISGINGGITGDGV